MKQSSVISLPLILYAFEGNKYSVTCTLSGGQNLLVHKIKDVLWCLNSFKVRAWSHGLVLNGQSDFQGSACTCDAL